MRMLREMIAGQCVASQGLIRCSQRKKRKRETPREDGKGWKERRGSRKHIDQETVVGRMPRGDATRGAGLSTYYEPRLLSSRFFFSPRGSPSTTTTPPPPPPLSFLLLLSLLLLLLLFLRHYLLAQPAENLFTLHYLERSALLILNLLVFGLVFIPNAV